jgi:hypothetical protein
VRTRRGVAAAVVMLLAACGSSGKPKSSAKTDFIAQADAICSSYNDLASKATNNLKHPNQRQMITAIQKRLVPLFQRQDDELAQLHPPAADRATVSQFIADLKAATNDVAVHPEAFVAAHGATPLARKAADEAAAYGFAVCARI